MQAAICTSSFNNLFGKRAQRVQVFVLFVLVTIVAGLTFIPSDAGAFTRYTVTNNVDYAGGVIVSNRPGGYAMGRLLPGQTFNGEVQYRASGGSLYFRGRAFGTLNNCFWIGPSAGTSGSYWSATSTSTSGCSAGQNTWLGTGASNFNSGGEIYSHANCAAPSSNSAIQATWGAFTFTTKPTGIYHNVSWQWNGSSYSATSTADASRATLPAGTPVYYRYTARGDRFAMVFIDGWASGGNQFEGGHGWAFVDASALTDRATLQYWSKPEDYPVAKRYSCTSVSSPGSVIEWPLTTTGVAGLTFRGTDTLTSGQRLNAGEYLMSNDVRTILYMQRDGNLVVYGGNFQPMWSSGTQGSGATFLYMQDDGNLALYTAQNVPVWNIGQQGNGPSRLTIQDDGNLVTYKNGGGATWATFKYIAGASPTQVATTTLASGQTLTRGQFVRSADKRYAFVFQSDGNLVLYGPGYHPLRYTSTSGSAADRVTMQTDGHLVMYAGSTAIWSTNTQGNPGARLDVQSDGNMAIYATSGAALWNTGTFGRL